MYLVELAVATEDLGLAAVYRMRTAEIT